MSTFSGNPYANPSETSQPEQQKTSIAAVLSLICGIGCCIPFVTPILAMLFGTVGLIRIGISNGRLRGKGMALTGLILGIIATVAWSAVSIGGMQMVGAIYSTAIQPTDQAMQALEKDDFKGFRAILAPAVESQLSDDDLKKFRDAYHQSAGAYTAGPASFWDYYGKLARMGSVVNRYQSMSGDMFPVSADFANGPGMIVLFVPPGAIDAKTKVVVDDIAVVTQDGTEVRLLGPNP